MSNTLTDLTRKIDDAFVNTWYKIRPEVINNVLEATILTLALKEKGCMKPQVGGTYGWTSKTIGYGDMDIEVQEFQRGSTLTQKVVPLDTMAYLDWRQMLVDVNRNYIDDQTNTGPDKIKDYVARRLEAARNALVQGIEARLFRWGNYLAAPKQMNGIWDIAAPYVALTATSPGAASDSQAVGTSNGNLNRTNLWWRNWVAYSGSSFSQTNHIATGTHAPYSLNLIPDMNHFFNSITNGQESPNLILASQAIFETYQEEMTDRVQIVRTGFDQKAADLGFQTVTFKGATFTYSQKMPTATNQILFLNLNHIDWNYNPNAWFDMTDWKSPADQLERVAYIICMTPGLATDQPRRHGVMTYAS